MALMSTEFQQVVNIESIFREFFKSYKPDRIIELGTMSGKFTHMIYNLRRELDNDFDIITFDINNYLVYGKVSSMPNKTTFHQMDILGNIDGIGKLIKDNTLVLCDNGHKVNEVCSLTPYLKENCVIMAHDYAYDKQRQLELGVWDYREIEFKDIEHLNLKPFMQELMETGAWLSMTK